MAQDDVFSAAFVTRIGTTQGATVLHLQQTSANQPTDQLGDLYEAIEQSGVFSDWAARSSDQAVLDCIKLQRIYPTRGEAFYYAPAIVGTRVSQSMPAQVGALHNWQADPYTRSSKGKHVWPGVPEEFTKWGRLNTTAFTLETAFAGPFEDPIASLAPTDYEYGVWSSKLDTFYGLGFVVPRSVLYQIRNRRGRPCI